MTAKLPCTLVAGALLLLAGFASADDKPAPPPPRPVEEVKPSGKVTPLELDYPPPPVATGIMPTDHVDPRCPAFQALWIDRPVPLRSLVGREVVTSHMRPTLEVKYRPEQREVIEIVLVPREVEKVVPCCVVHEEKETDAHGHCCMVPKVVTEDKVVKETIYEPKEQKRIVEIQVPSLKAVEVEVPQKSVLFECRTEFRPDGYAILVPDYLELKPFFVAPCPTCAAPAPCAAPGH